MAEKRRRKREQEKQIELVKSQSQNGHKYHMRTREKSPLRKSCDSNSFEFFADGTSAERSNKSDESTSSD